MIFVKVLLYIVEVVVCVLLGLIVMLQKPKEGGLGGAFGGGALEASLGADAGNILIRATAILGTIFL
ncbi:MAG: preprotein translocase subunit SecG, partial [Kiritimatiellae bacterium]|nr:preprotein translocase subunit SecG [Kiritimatiellia bacterium]